MPEEIQDKYNSLTEYAKGATSLIYSAICNDTNEKVAIKQFIYNKNINESSFLEQWKRIKREVEVHLSLNHPNIIKAHKHYEKGSKLYLVLDFIEGKNLQELIDSGHKFDIVDAVKIIKQIANAISYLDEKGIVHRDIKPSNIVVTKDKKAYLLDFGCAKKMYSEPITVSKMMIGTLSYMSPEQLLSLDIDGRSDLFSLGCTLYQLLSGSLPFKGEDIREIITGIFNSENPSVKDLNSYVPEKLSSLVDLSLKKDPDHRCPTAKLFSYHLEKILEEAEIYLNQGKYYEEEKKDLSSSYVFYKKALSLDSNNIEAITKLANIYYLSENWKNALEYYNHVINHDSSNPEYYSRLGDIYVHTQNYSQSLKMYQKAVFLSPEKRYEMKMAKSLFLCKKFDESAHSYKSILNRYLDNTDVKYELGLVYYKSGKINDAMKVFESTLDKEPYHQGILSSLGALYQEIGNTPKAIKVYEELLKLDPTSTVLLHNLACAYYQTNNIEKAKIKLAELIKLNGACIESYILLGLIFEKEGKYDLAIHSYKEILNIEHDNISAYLYISSCYRAQWRLDDTVNTLIDAVKLNTKYSKGEVFFQLGEAYREQGFYHKAKIAYKECVQITGTGNLYEAAKHQLKYLNASDRKKRTSLLDYVKEIV
jgi:serine/threonine protein kinase/lipoprotein NlpI